MKDSSRSTLRKPDWYYNQTGVIPYRMNGNRPEFLLITTRTRKHWIFPKGIVEPGQTFKETARREAFEEAGVSGRIHPEPLGTYCFPKWKGVCRVTVFGMEVEKTEEDWPEKNIRVRRWFSPEEAADGIHHPDLASLCRTLTDRVLPSPQG
ncbi:MAG: NUDIX hydrolase [Acidobacteria bacterium]|nr:NUDIX hydrolase [Acidobacteriota bacterium]MBU1338245.1 NUDIX hydrolase [Acidobacteriota bacterium]MBU1475128.1 NUDIX hydrolase [Acidobacteriota bacterium]